MSEEQAAEAAHQQSERAGEGEGDEEVVIQDGEEDGDVEADGVDAMEEDQQQVTKAHYICWMK